MKSNELSLLTRNESASFKGILMFLIVLGHNMFFSYSTERFQGMGLLYSFHIQSFFLLPFLYPLKSLTKERFLSLLCRYYVPFFEMLILLTLFKIFYTGKISGTFFEWLSCAVFSGPYLQNFTGNQFLWFLPAMFLSMCLKEFFAGCKKTDKTVLCLIASVMCVIYLFGIPNHPAGIIQKIWDNAAYLKYALIYLVSGLLLRQLIQELFTGQKVKRYIIGFLYLLFFIGILCYFLNYFHIVLPRYHYHAESIIENILRLIMPLLFLSILYIHRRKIGTLPTLQKIGNASMVLYLFHPFIGYSCWWFYQRWNLPGATFWYIIPVQVLMLYIPWTIYRSLDHLPRIKKILLPRTLSDLKWR